MEQSPGGRDAGLSLGSVRLRLLELCIRRGGLEILEDSEISTLQFKHVILPMSMDERVTITTGLDVSYEVSDSDSGFVPSFDESEYRRRLIGIFGHVEARPTDGLTLTGEAVVVEPLGREDLVGVSINGADMRVLVDKTRGVRVGDTISLVFNTNRTQFFDPETEASLPWA